MTPLEVIDTAVKVGLGALISGLSTYWVTARKSKDDLSRERLQRHQVLLEESAVQVESCAHVVLRYWALMVELVRYRAQGIQWPTSRSDELEKTKADLFNSFSSMTSAESKLLLLGHANAQRLLREFGELTRSFRRSAFDGNLSLTEDELDDHRFKLLTAREAFFAELSRVYRAET